MYIPHEYLPSPSYLYVSLTYPIPYSNHTSDSRERAFFWLPNETEPQQWPDPMESPLSERQHMYQNDVMRVRVMTDKFWDDEPGPPKANDGAPDAENRRAPFVITVRAFICYANVYSYCVQCSIDEQGLGIVDWWMGQQVEED